MNLLQRGKLGEPAGENNMSGAEAVIEPLEAVPIVNAVETAGIFMEHRH